VVRTPGTGYELFIDGISDGTCLDTSDCTSTHPLEFGRNTRTDRELKWWGELSDPCIWRARLGQSELSALADPSNVDLRVGGIPAILPPARRWWPVAVAEEGPTPWLYARQQVRIIGGGMI